MWDWITANASLIQATAGIVTALVWIVYLQLLVTGLRRERRTEILIHLGGGRDLNARTFVSNLGFEPIYILEILLTIQTSDGARETSIVDRKELKAADLVTPSQTTLQGPLKSGEFIDIGNFEDLFERARWSTSGPLDPDDIGQVNVTVAAISAANSTLVAAKREFKIEIANQARHIRPKHLYATQIKSWWGRLKLEKQLQAQL